jgi:mannose/fructose-specific phosphotransferase system component IIA
MIFALLITHGDLGKELLKSAETIIGKYEGMTAISNTGLSGEDLQVCIEEEMAKAKEMVIFVDCFGSTLTSAKIICGNRFPIICGVNLPMILSFLTKRNQIPFKDLPEILIEDGKRGICWK